ncbi:MULTISPECIES: GNAT family N-acetyltransferase [unclassified Acidovorax]|uniref:GNAT family N-acetyltransferase n=1 Tax=unclassified Acidovorax TaxID=2684926 RepID=UPI0037C7362A
MSGIVTGVCFVPWSDANDGATVRWLNDPAIRASFGITGSVTLESHRQWRRQHTSLAAWAIEADSIHCGNFLLDINPRHASAYLQIYIGETYLQGRGIGRQAVALGLVKAFGTLAMNRVWLHTRQDNPRARHLYESLGFRYEGTERESIRDGDRFLNQDRWALLRADWRSP